MAMESLLIIIVVLAVLLIVGVPISYSIGISALIAILRTVPLEVSVVTGAQRIFVGMSKFSLTAIPFFILAGNLMNQGGIAKRLVRGKRPFRRYFRFGLCRSSSRRKYGGKGRRGTGL